MSQTIRESIDLIRNIAQKMPKTINEAMEYDEEFDQEGVYEPMQDEVEDDAPIDMEKITKDEKVDEVYGPDKARTLIDDIRKQALRAMAELADTPDCAEYENLKRIWQLCDKAVSEKQQQGGTQSQQNEI